VQFSDTTNKNGVIQKIELLLQMQDGAISGDTVLLKQFTGLVNDAYNEVSASILSMSPNWAWDDSNYTDHPRGVANLVADQRDYALPVAASGNNASTLLTVEGISILDIGGNETRLSPTDLEESYLNEFYSTSGLPAVYRLTGNSVKIWPAASSSSTTLTNGLIIYFRRTPDQFTSADTTQQPGFALPYHQILAYKAALDYATIRGLSNVQFLQLRVQELMNGLKELYAERDKSFKNKISPRRESYK
jgi:hypothetical protein